MTQKPTTITVKEKWGSGGYTILISDNETAYSISFADSGELRIHACKLVEGRIEFDHSPDRGIAIDLKESHYHAWGLHPADIRTINNLFDVKEKNLLKLREALAALEHKQWAHWTKHSLCNITAENISRWNRLVQTPYSDLTEDEKDSDRVWADEVLETFLRIA